MKALQCNLKYFSMDDFRQIESVRQPSAETYTADVKDDLIAINWAQYHHRQGSAQVEVLLWRSKDEVILIRGPCSTF